MNAGPVHPIAVLAMEQQRDMRLTMIEAAVKLECAAEHLAGFGMELTGASCKETAAKVREFLGMPK